MAATNSQLYRPGSLGIGMNLDGFHPCLLVLGDWHGLSQAGAPLSDGTPLASQWPIPPFHFFDYALNISIGEAGTYYYQSHVGFQAVSATGPLIVDSLTIPPPYRYDDEKIVFIQDTFSEDFSTIEKGLIDSPIVWSGEAAAILVNGKGGGTANGTMCNASLSIIHVEPGKTYRLRVIGATALTFASLAIQGHWDLEVIEADGAYTQSANASYLQVPAGQRFSVLLHTLPKPSQQAYSIQLESRDRPTITRSFTILNYGPRSSSSFYPPLKPVLFLSNSTVGFLDYQLHPLYPSSDFPSASEVTRTVTITAHQAVCSMTIWTQNNYPWTEDSAGTIPRVFVQERQHRIPLHGPSSSKRRSRSSFTGISGGDRGSG